MNTTGDNFQRLFSWVARTSRAMTDWVGSISIKLKVLYIASRMFAVVCV
jgi:hypothetical protein